MNISAPRDNALLSVYLSDEKGIKLIVVKEAFKSIPYKNRINDTGLSGLDTKNYEITSAAMLKMMKL